MRELLIMEIRKHLKLPDKPPEETYQDEIVHRIDEAILDMKDAKRERRIALAKIKQEESG